MPRSDRTEGVIPGYGPGSCGPGSNELISSDPLYSKDFFNPKPPHQQTPPATKGTSSSSSSSPPVSSPSSSSNPGDDNHGGGDVGIARARQQALSRDIKTEHFFDVLQGNKPKGFPEQPEYAESERYTQQDGYVEDMMGLSRGQMRTYRAEIAQQTSNEVSDAPQAAKSKKEVKQDDFSLEQGVKLENEEIDARKKIKKEESSPDFDVKPVLQSARKKKPTKKNAKKATKVESSDSDSDHGVKVPAQKTQQRKSTKAEEKDTTTFPSTPEDVVQTPADDQRYQYRQSELLKSSTSPESEKEYDSDSSGSIPATTDTTKTNTTSSLAKRKPAPLNRASKKKTQPKKESNMRRTPKTASNTQPTPINSTLHEGPSARTRSRKCQPNAKPPNTIKLPSTPENPPLDYDSEGDTCGSDVRGRRSKREVMTGSPKPRRRQLQESRSPGQDGDGHDGSDGDLRPETEKDNPFWPEMSLDFEEHIVIPKKTREEKVAFQKLSMMERIELVRRDEALSGRHGGGCFDSDSEDAD